MIWRSRKLDARALGVAAVFALVAMMAVPAIATEAPPDVGAAVEAPAGPGAGGEGLPQPAPGDDAQADDVALAALSEKLIGSLPSYADVLDFVVSPDGNRVVYRADAGLTDNKYHLYSVPIDGGFPARLSADTLLDGDVEPDYAVSPDSTRVVFRQPSLFLPGGDRLYSVPIQGGARTILDNTVEDFVISPDSARVVYRVDDPANGNLDLWSHPITAGTGVRLNSNATHDAKPDYAVSADSSRVVFRQDLTSFPVTIYTQTQLHSVPITGGTVAWLNGSFQARRDVAAFLVSEDSARVVFLGDLTTNDKWELYSVPIGGATGYVKVNGAITGMVSAFNISPDSSRVVYRADGNILGQNELYSVPITGPTGANPVWTINGLMALGGDVETDFKISPDSQTVVFRADQDVDDDTELFSNSIVPAIGFLAKLNQPLASGGDVLGGFEIAPDSSRVVYIADERKSGLNELFGVRLDGTDHVLLAQMDFLILPFFRNVRLQVLDLVITPDSNRVVYRVRTQSAPATYHAELFTTPVWSSNPLQLNGEMVVGGIVYPDYAITSDSRWVVYRADEDTDNKIELYAVLVNPDLLVGLGSDSQGWLEDMAARPPHNSRGWMRADWSAYNSASGETRPVTCDVDGDGLMETVIGFGPFPADGGWVQVRDDVVAGSGHLAWLQVGWSAYNSANGETYPACGDLDGDGNAEIAVGLGPQGLGWVQLFDDATTGYTPLTGTPSANGWVRLDWTGYNNAAGEIHPAIGNLDSDLAAELALGTTTGGDGWVQILDDAASGFAPLGGTPTANGWVQLDWPTYNSANGEVWPTVCDSTSSSGGWLVLGVGNGGNGWLQALNSGTGFTSYSWVQSGWTDYNTAKGAVYPACGDADADGRDELVIGFDSYPSFGGWVDVRDSSSSFNHLAWARVHWSSYNTANGATRPAVLG